MTSQTITNALIALAALALIWGLWRAAQPGRVFRIRIINGTPQCKSGTVSPAFLESIYDIAAANDITSGTIDGHAQGRFVRLRFSADVPEPTRQQIRNVWTSYGWDAPTRSRRR